MGGGRAARPLLALLCGRGPRCAAARHGRLDLGDAAGRPGDAPGHCQATAEAFPSRYNPTTLANVGRHAASSWQQSGHLRGRQHKTRDQAATTPAATAYALLLGYLCGARGEALLQTLWRVSVGRPPAPAARPSLCRIPAGAAGVSPHRRRDRDHLSSFAAFRARKWHAVSEIDLLLQRYTHVVNLPWSGSLSGAERVWFLVYTPSQERRLRLRLGDFRTATQNAGHGWHEIDVSDSFARWMANHKYREAYFQAPELLEAALGGYVDFLTSQIEAQLAPRVAPLSSGGRLGGQREPALDPNTVVALTGLASLFGLASVSALVNAVRNAVPGRLLILFPGHKEGFQLPLSRSARRLELSFYRHYGHRRNRAMTQNHTIFQRDPTTFTIPNDGVAEVGAPQTPEQWNVLRYELESFVCEGEYRDGLVRILRTYLAYLGKDKQPAVWVSGFYGSGKSHLVRVLEYLWYDIEFPDGAHARGLVHLTPEIEELFAGTLHRRPAPGRAVGHGRQPRRRRRQHPAGPAGHPLPKRRSARPVCPGVFCDLAQTAWSLCHGQSRGRGSRREL